MSIQTQQTHLRAWLEARQPNAFLTFNFGYAVNQFDGERQIKHFFNALQCKDHGRNWAKRPTGDRTMRQPRLTGPPIAPRSGFCPKTKFRPSPRRRSGCRQPGLAKGERRHIRA